MRFVPEIPIIYKDDAIIQLTRGTALLVNLLINTLHCIISVTTSNKSSNYVSNCDFLIWAYCRRVFNLPSDDVGVNLAIRICLERYCNIKNLNKVAAVVITFENLSHTTLTIYIYVIPRSSALVSVSPSSRK